MFNFTKNRKLKLSIFAVACVAIVFVWSVFIWQAEISKFVAYASQKLNECVGFLDGVPLAFYALAIFALPMIFLPVTPIYFVAAARTDEHSYFAVLLCCLVGVTANIIVSYFIGRKFGIAIRDILSSRGVNLPRLPRSSHGEFVFLFRMIPGNPLAVQNYALGAAGVAFAPYMAVSLAIQYVQIAAYIYFGEGIFEGGFSKIVLGSSVLLSAAIIARIVEKRYAYKLKGNDEFSETK